MEDTIGEMIGSLGAKVDAEPLLEQRIGNRSVYLSCHDGDSDR